MHNMSVNHVPSADTSTLRQPVLLGGRETQRGGRRREDNRPTEEEEKKH